MKFATIFVQSHDRLLQNIESSGERGWDGEHHNPLRQRGNKGSNNAVPHSRFGL
jgi:hypothetical protein